MTGPLALIIEDEPNLASIFSLAFSLAGFETEIISDGEVALARLAGEAPHLVMLDMHIPRVSGEQVLQQIRSEGRWTKTYIIMATADIPLADRLEDQVNLVLVKPISASHLRQLAQKLRQSQAFSD